MNSYNRRISFCYLRIISTILIVLLHACSTLTDNPDMFTLSAGETAFFLIGQSITRWCVPCFLMISGALLLRIDRTITVKDAIIKYARRMFLALIVFGIPFALMINFFATRKLSPGMIPDAIIRVLTNNSFAHLWYVYMLIGIYLLLPAIKAFVDNCSTKTLEYTLIALAVFNCLIPFISQLTGANIAFSLPVTTCYLFYFLMGHYISEKKPTWSGKRGLIIACTLIAIGIIIWMCSMHGSLIGIIASYSSPVVAMCAIGMFCIFIPVKKTVHEDFVWKTDRLCFGVYLIHPLFIHILYKALGIVPVGCMYIIKTIMITVLVTILSFVVSWIMRLIPPLKKYVL